MALNRDLDALLGQLASFVPGSARQELLDLRKYARGAGSAGSGLLRMLGLTRGRAGGLLNQIIGIVSGNTRGLQYSPRQVEAAKQLLRDAGYDLNLRTGGRGGMIQPPPLPGRLVPGSITPPPLPALQPSLEPGRDFGGRGVPQLARPGEASPYGEEVLAPESSNVFSFSFMGESRTTGILYVTFKTVGPHGQRPNSAGAVYAYYSVPASLYRSLRNAYASKGKWIWDHLRIRGTVWGHQFTYRLVSADIRISAAGAEAYIPRKATRAGFKKRAALPVLGQGRQGI